ncbi:hypothetical protein [Mycobacteroides abscessus]|jgi:hypothetical protein|uniref:hypothetical protein n=1 Tax=Mycobacteroides abscessus TaxID=36809 RepID=UPI001C657768|nr:hypothetical protein [Mycobacteroides abscessus]
MVEWASPRNWHRRATGAKNLPVLEIADRDTVPFPGFDRVRLTHHELRERAEPVNAERSFRRIKGYKQMPQLVEASTGTLTSTRPRTPKLSEPPQRVQTGSSPKCHETRHISTADVAPNNATTATVGCRSLVQ